MFPGMFEENLTSVIEKNVAQGLRARIEPQGVTGINYIDINYVNDPSQFPTRRRLEAPLLLHPVGAGPAHQHARLDQHYHASGPAAKYRRHEQLAELLANLNKAVTGAEITKLSADLQTLLGEFREASKQLTSVR